MGLDLLLVFFAMETNMSAHSSRSVVCLSTALSSRVLIISGEYNRPFNSSQLSLFVPQWALFSFLTHSVNKRPGSTALMRTLLPCVFARQRIKCNCAALVTEYAIELPESDVPAMEDVMMNTPPSGLALNVGIASRTRAIWPLTFTAQHCCLSVSVVIFPFWQECLVSLYFIPFFFC